MWQIPVKALSGFIVLLGSAVSSVGQFSGEFTIPKDTLITLERVALFDCPVCVPQPNYNLTISADGTVIFKGNKHVKVVGEAKGKISEKELRGLLIEFDRVNYFSLHERYEWKNDGCPVYITDRPFVYTSIQISGRKKAISHYYGCVEDKDDRYIIFQQQLFNLEKKIDEVVNTKQWID